MGSEMCIRDRDELLRFGRREGVDGVVAVHGALATDGVVGLLHLCLLYTSDAADERSSVDLGGRRIIKKKKTVRASGGSHQK